MFTRPTAYQVPLQGVDDPGVVAPLPGDAARASLSIWVSDVEVPAMGHCQPRDTCSLLRVYRYDKPMVLNGRASSECRRCRVLVRCLMALNRKVPSSVQLGITVVAPSN